MRPLAHPTPARARAPTTRGLACQRPPKARPEARCVSPPVARSTVGTASLPTSTPPNGTRHDARLSVGRVRHRPWAAQPPSPHRRPAAGPAQPTPGSRAPQTDVSAGEAHIQCTASEKMMYTAYGQFSRVALCRKSSIPQEDWPFMILSDRPHPCPCRTATAPSPRPNCPQLVTLSVCCLLLSAKFSASRSVLRWDNRNA